MIFVFTRRRIYKRFRKDSLLSLAMREMGGRIICIYFDILQQRKTDDARARLVTAANKLYRRTNRFDQRIAELLRSADYCLVQFAGGYVPGVMRRKNISGPRIIKYPHTSGPTLYDANEAKKRVPVQRATPSDFIAMYCGSAQSQHSMFLSAMPYTVKGRMSLGSLSHSRL